MNGLGILVNRKSKVPLHRQLEDAMRAAILSGNLKAGTRILSSRELQTHLGLSRNTIVGALDQLHAEGYLVTHRGIGTFVALHVHEFPSTLASAKTGANVFPSDAAARFAQYNPLAVNLRATAPFRPGMPALDLFPSSQFKRGFNTADWTVELLDYASAPGHEGLRAAIAQRLAQTRGIVCSPDQVLIVGGAQAAFSLICSVLLNKNDGAIIEDPGYSNGRAILLAHGARVHAAPIDGAGIVVRSFAKRRAKLAYITPSHQYPSGVVLSLDRRFALLDWAANHDAWIIEDDYDSEFNYTGRPQPALQGLGRGQRVIYIGTFSKVLSPALRVAYLVIPNSLRDAFLAAHQVTAGSPSTILQAAVARFMQEGYFGRHVAKMRKVYDERRRFVSGELGGAAGGAFRVHDSRSGLHFVAELPRTINDAEFSKRAAARGIIAPALSSYYHGRPARNGIVIGYAASSIPRSKKAIAELVASL